MTDDQELKESYFGRKVREVASAKGWTPRSWAVEAKVDTSNFYGALAGRRKLVNDDLEKLASVEAIGVTFEELKAWRGVDKIGGEEEFQAVVEHILPKSLQGMKVASEIPLPEPKPERAPEAKKTAALSRLAEFLLEQKGAYPGAGYRDFARMLDTDEEFLGDVIWAGHLPERKVLRKWAHYLRVDPQVLYDLTKPLPKGASTQNFIVVPSVNLPYFGQVGCGPLLEPDAVSTETRAIPSHLIQDEDPTKLTVVEASGDSMVSAGINAGDYLVVRRQDHAKPNEVVVANVPYLGSTCKRIRARSDGQFELVADSPAPHAPILITEGVNIVGKVVAKWSEKRFA